MTKERFMQQVMEWNRQRKDGERIKNLSWNGEESVQFGEDGCRMRIDRYRNIIAVRYENAEENPEHGRADWELDYVMDFDERECSVSLSRRFEKGRVYEPPFNTPSFINRLIEGGFLEDDDGLPILNRPVVVTEENLHILLDIINNGKRYRLPVVYITNKINGEYPVNVQRVADILKGQAHVFLEGDASIQSRLRDQCGKKSLYNGYIGIYFRESSQNGGYTAIAPSTASRKMMEEILRRVRVYGLSGEAGPYSTWDKVAYAALKEKCAKKQEELELAKYHAKVANTAALIAADEAKAKVDEAAREAEAAKEESGHVKGELEQVKELYEYADDDVKNLKKTIEELKARNTVLSDENERLKARWHETENAPLLYFGEEKEFFPGEVKEIVLEALDEKIKNTQVKAGERIRRADILKDIVESNGGLTNLPAEKKKELDRLFKGYRGLTEPMKSGMKKLGLMLSSDNKHQKITYYGDQRYVEQLSKSAGDCRTGKATSQQIYRKMF